MLESAIQGKVVAYARSKGILARKLDFGMGWPDYLFLARGLALFIEFKRHDGKPTKLQEHVHGELRRRNFRVEIIRDVDEGIALLDNFYGILAGQPPEKS
jgi:hypothetical protein